MSENAHDPPGLAQRLDALSGPGREKYQLMAERLQEDPMAVIERMRTGGYRFKQRRGAAPGVLMVRAGSPVKERMSFRQIAPELERLTGVSTTYETIRRWSLLDIRVRTEQAMVKKRAKRRDRTRAAKAAKATEAVQSESTNPDVPPVTFLLPPPVE